MLRHTLTLLAVVFTVACPAQTVQIGYSPVTGACVASDYANRSRLPWQTPKDVFARGDGIQSMGAIVQSSKSDVRQSEEERKMLERCVRLSTRKVLTGGLNNTSSAVEDQVLQGTNACLREATVDLSVRFITLAKGPIECVPTVTAIQGRNSSINTNVSVMVISFRETADAAIARVIISSLVSRGFSVFDGRWDDEKSPSREIEIHYKPAARAAAFEVQAIVEEAYHLAGKRPPNKLVPVPLEVWNDKNDIRIRIF